MKRIPLSKGFVALVDDRDYVRLARYEWYASGYTLRSGLVKWRAVRNIRRPDGKKRLQYMHREIMGAPPGVDVDHKRGDGLDNRRRNLRLATRSQNNQNQRNGRRHKSSRFKGVSWDGRDGRWHAYITPPGGRRKSLGYFGGEAAAARAYDEAARRLFGEFAAPNSLGAK